VRTSTALVLGLLAAGARADDLDARAARSYAIDVSRSTTAAAVGEHGVLVVAIRCEPGVHVQPQAPLRMTVSASSGLALEKERLGWPDVRGGTESPEIEVPFTATAPGAQAVRARLEFFVCSKHWCVGQDRDVVLPVAVQGAGSSASEPASPNPATSAREG
jgi:hypothetical protein